MCSKEVKHLMMYALMKDKALRKNKFENRTPDKVKSIFRKYLLL